MPAGKVYQAGTLSGNPLATAAGCATLRLLREQPPYAYLETISQRLAEGLEQAATSAGIAAHVQRVGSMMTLFFNPDSVVDWKTADRSDRKKFAKFFWGLIDRGVYFPCSQFEALFVSQAHTETEIEETIQAAREAIQLCK